MKPREVTLSGITAYCADRLRTGATPATVQREVSCLRRMFRLALKQGLISSVPIFPQVETDGLNARQGFFTDKDFQKVCAALPNHLAVLATIGFWTGARKGELLSLEWRHIDLNSGKVEIPAGMCKNKRARSFFLPRAALNAVHEWRRTTREFEMKHQVLVSLVFHRSGKPIKNFRVQLNKVFRETGIERRVFHDLRRTAVKNYVDAGVAKTTVMSISGHVTQKVFERYNVRDTDRDQQDAAHAISKRLSLLRQTGIEERG